MDPSWKYDLERPAVTGLGELEEASAQQALLRGQLAAKRMVDISVSLMCLVVLMPFLLFIFAAIKIESRGPAIFRQRRWGKDGRIITVLKFRSMRTDAGDPTGVAQTRLNDDRLTRIGGFLRKSNLDELPQLFNVLKGDMSLVGPRCHVMGMIAAGKLYEELVPNYHLRHRMRPGITGLAQMRGLRGPAVSYAKARARVICDIYYVDHFSLLLDLQIIFGTLRNEVFKGGTGS
jgi:lipopolysaccharide/colanic/teichoic acid biosynthesis glycosyltransferase